MPEENMIVMFQPKKMAFRPLADNKGQDQTAHLRSLIWAFVARLQNLWAMYNILTKKGEGLVGPCRYEYGIRDIFARCVPYYVCSRVH